jgi:hypothetical protein
MRIRIPVRDGVAVLIDDHCCELETSDRGATVTWPLDVDALLTMRDGCDAAFKLWQVKRRNVTTAGRCRQGDKIKSPTGGVWTRSDNEHLMSSPPRCRWRDEAGASHTLKCDDEVELIK